MNSQEAVNEGIAAFRRATTNGLASRTILVLSVLDVTPRAEVAKALADVDSAGKTPSASTIRRSIGRTTRQMGLPALPTGEKGGRPSFEICDAYKREHCARWIAANGGMPRNEQLADPNWDLRPYRPLGDQELQGNTSPAPIRTSAQLEVTPSPLGSNPATTDAHETLQALKSSLEEEADRSIPSRKRIKVPVVKVDSFEQQPAPPLKIPVDIPSGELPPLRSEINQDRRK
jgi:hypothetical protein